MKRHDESVLKFGVVGDPVAHSHSPEMFNAAFAAKNMACEYTRFHVTKNDLPAFMLQLKEQKIMGCNITLPHKEDVIQYLDALTPEAQKIGAVNTVFWQNNQLTGDNTDAAGFWMSVSPHLTEPHKKSCLVLGAGGASRAVCFSLLQNGVQHLIITNRNHDKALLLQKHLQNFFTKTSIEVFDWQNFLESGFAKADLVVNTTSLGIKNSSWPRLDFMNVLHKNTIVCDIVANPTQTKLLQAAQSKNLAVIFGHVMLWHQACIAFEKFTGQEAPAKIMRDALFAALDQDVRNSNF